MKGSYAYLYANCAELYDRELASDNTSLDPNMQQAGPKSLDFWPKLISLVVSVIEEDKGVYTHILNQYEPALLQPYIILITVKHVESRHPLLSSLSLLSSPKNFVPMFAVEPLSTGHIH